jgi:TonB family protein
MKYCPKCETKYDDEVIRFCTKDGSPLIAEEEPKFIEMPSEDLEQHETDDPSELTVIRRNVTPPPSLPPPPPSSLDDITFDANDEPPPRIVVPTDEEPIVFPQPRRTERPPQAYYPPQKSNTAVVVLLTIIGTTIVLGGAGLLFWLLQRDHNSNTNNANLNTNLENVNLGINNNLNIGGNFNFNTNYNANANANANVKTPTPTPKPSPSPSETPLDGNTSFPNSNVRLPVNSMTTPTPTPRPTLPPSTNRPVNGGVLNGRAVNLAVPSYPQLARAVHAAGQVTVEVSVDESGRITSAKAVSGNPLLRSAAESAARQSRIIPTRINNENVKTTGLLVYNFKDN